MKKKYLTPETETCLITLEKHFLDASLGGRSTGEDLGSKFSYDLAWEE